MHSSSKLSQVETISAPVAFSRVVTGVLPSYYRPTHVLTTTSPCDKRLCLRTSNVAHKSSDRASVVRQGEPGRSTILDNPCGRANYCRVEPGRLGLSPPGVPGEAAVGPQDGTEGPPVRGGCGPEDVGDTCGSQGKGTRRLARNP
jgi:hypothetical protein